MDGFSINLAEDGVFLVVEPGCEVSIGEVATALRERRITDYNSQAVKMALEKKEGSPVLIADPQKEEDREADFRIKISEDGLKCELWLIPPSGNAAMPTM